MLDLVLDSSVEGQPSIRELGLPCGLLDNRRKDARRGRKTTRLRTRADNAFLRASAAALRVCIWEFSLASSAESMVMYAG